MAGRGPAPKEPAKRARRNGGRPDLRVIEAEPVDQPPLPTIEVERDGELVEFRWPARTEAWWSMWGGSPLAPEFTASDWDFLLDTALIHARFWTGDIKAGPELRLRVAKFGATPEDRARLKITFAAAEAAETDRRTPAAGKRREGLRLAE